MSVLRRLITAIEAKVDQGGFAKADKHIDGLARGFEKVGHAADRLTGKVQTAIAAFAGFGAFKGLVDTNIEAQKLAAQLQAVTGSAEKGAEAFAFIQEFAKTTPFELNNVTMAFVKLKAAGIEPTAKTMKAVGDLAAANSTTIAQAASAITKANKGLVEEAGSQLNIAGKVSKDTVNFTVQGIEHTVTRSGQNIADFLIGVGETKFSSAMETQMETVGGKLSNLSDATTAFKVKVGESGLNGAITRLVDKLIEWTNASDGLAVKLGGGLGAAVDGLATGLETIAAHSTAAQAALAGLAGVVAGGKIVGVIGGMADALSRFSDTKFFGAVVKEIIEIVQVVRYLGVGGTAAVGAVLVAFAGLATGIAEGIGLERIMELVTSLGDFVTKVLGSAVAAVTRVGAAIFTAIFEPARAVGQVIGEILGALIGPLTTVLEWLGSVLGDIFGIVGDIGVFVADIAGGALMIIAKTLRVVFQLIKKGFDGIVWVLEELGIIDMIKAAWDLLKQAIDWFKGALQKVGDVFRDMFATLLNPILEIISDSINKLKRIIRSLPVDLGKDISEWAAKDSDFSIKTSDQLRHERENAAAMEGFLGGLAGGAPTAPAFDASAYMASIKGQSMSQIVNAGGITINVTAADNSPAEIAEATKEGTNKALSGFAADIVGVQ